MNMIEWLHTRGRGRRLGPRLLAAIVLASTCLALLVTGVQLYLDYSRELSEIDAEFAQIESSALDSLASSLSSFDSNQTRLQLDGLVKMRDVRFVEVRGHHGEHFTAGTRAGERTVGREYVLHAPRMRRAPVGLLTVSVGLDGVYSRIVDRTLVVLATQATETFFIALFILYLVSRWITRHLDVWRATLAAKASIVWANRSCCPAIRTTDRTSSMKWRRH